MVENEQSKYYKYLDDLTKINDVIIDQQNKKRAMEEKKRKQKEHQEYLRYQSIHDCLINIMTDKKLLEAVQKYGAAKGSKAHIIKFAEGGSSDPNYQGYDHLAIRPSQYISAINFNFEKYRSQNEVKFYIAMIRDWGKEKNIISYNELYIEKNKVRFEYCTNRHSAAQAIYHENDIRGAPDVKQHNAKSIVASLENALKNLLSEYTK